MTTQELITALRLQGHKVSARKRTDGGWLITKIDRTSYTGAKGNQRARNLLGIEYSKKRLEQARYNVSQYIRGKKKTRTLEDDIKRQLRKVQKVWRKNKVKGRITAQNVKRHEQRNKDTYSKADKQNQELDYQPLTVSLPS